MNLLRLMAAALALAVPVATQPDTQPDATSAARLARLLDELRTLPASAWAEHATATKKEAEQLRARAAALRAEADELERRAAALARESETLQALRKAMAPAAAPNKQPAAQANRQPEPMAKGQPKPTAKPGAEPKPPAKAEPKPPAKTEPKPPAKTEPKPPAKTAPAAMAPSSPATPAPPKTVVTYADQIEPVLDEHCMVCHDSDDPSGGLDLSSYANLLEGGSSGTTLVPGDADGSRIYRLVAHLDRPFMPKEAAKLPAPQIEQLRLWIAQGAPETPAQAAAAFAEVQARAGATDVAAPEEAAFDSPPPMPAALPAVPLATARHAPPVRALASSPRAPLVAVAGHHQVLLLHGDSQETLGVLPFAGVVHALRFSRDGAHLLAAGGEPGGRGHAALYDVASGAVERSFDPGRGVALAAALSPDASRVALGGETQRVRVFDTATGDRLHDLRGHNDWVLACDFSADGASLASVDRGGGLVLWETDSGREHLSLSPKAGALAAARFSPDGAAVAVGGSSGEVVVLRARDGAARWRKSHGAPVLTLAWRGTAEGAALGSAGRDGRVRLWDSRGGTVARSPRLGDWVYALAFSAAGEAVFAGDYRGQLHVLKASDGTALSDARTPAAPVRSDI